MFTVQQLGYRHMVALCFMFATVTIYIGRINLSIAIVAMVRPEMIDNSNATESDVCLQDSGNRSSSSSSSTTHRSGRVFEWNQGLQGHILGSFFYGYVVMMPVAGRLSELVGPRALSLVSIVGTGIINLATPLLLLYTPSEVSTALLLASRVILGFVQSFIFPACYTLISRWTPDHERSVVSSLPTFGSKLGSIIASFGSGYLCDHGFAQGWPSVFYVSGAISILFGIIFYFLVTDDPQNHPLTSKEEYYFITSNIDNSRRGDASPSTSSRTKPPFPWRQVAMSRPVYVAVLLKCTTTWFVAVVMLKLPQYLHQVLGIEIKQSGIYSSIIISASCVSNLIGGLLADRLIKQNRYCKTTIRKVFQSIASLGTAVILFLVPQSGCDRGLFLGLMVAAQLTMGMEAGGELSLWSDLTNEFTASIFSLGNMSGWIWGVITPLIIGVMQDNDPQHKRLQWSYVYYISTGIIALGGVLFLLFGSAERLQWDDHLSSGKTETVNNQEVYDDRQKEKVESDKVSNIVKNGNI